MAWHGQYKLHLLLKQYLLRSTGWEVGNYIGFLSDNALQYQPLRQEPEIYHGLLPVERIKTTVSPLHLLVFVAVPFDAWSPLA